MGIGFGSGKGSVGKGVGFGGGFVGGGGVTQGMGGGTGDTKFMSNSGGVALGGIGGGGVGFHGIGGGGGIGGGPPLPPMPGPSPGGIGVASVGVPGGNPASTTLFGQGGYYGSGQNTPPGSGGGGAGGSGGGTAMAGPDLSNVTGGDPTYDAWLADYKKRIEELKGREFDAIDTSRERGIISGSIADTGAAQQAGLEESLAARGLEGGPESVAGQLTRQLSEGTSAYKNRAVADMEMRKAAEQRATDLAREGMLTGALQTGVEFAKTPAQLALQRQGLTLAQWQAQQGAAQGWSGQDLQRQQLAAQIEQGNRSYQQSEADRAMAQWQAMMGMYGY